MACPSNKAGVQLDVEDRGRLGLNIAKPPIPSVDGRITHREYLLAHQYTDYNDIL